MSASIGAEGRKPVCDGGVGGDDGGCDGGVPYLGPGEWDKGADRDEQAHDGGAAGGCVYDGVFGCAVGFGG